MLGKATALVVRTELEKDRYSYGINNKLKFQIKYLYALIFTQTGCLLQIKNQ